jgi:hypothetical protein
MVTVNDILERYNLLARLCCCSKVDTKKYFKEFKDFCNSNIDDIKELNNDELRAIWNENNGT